MLSSMASAFYVWEGTLEITFTPIYFTFAHLKTDEIKEDSKVLIALWEI